MDDQGNFTPFPGPSHERDDTGGDTLLGTWARLGEVTARARWHAETDDCWDGNLTPMPLGTREREGLVALGRLLRVEEGLSHAIRRYSFIATAHGLGLGMDLDLVLGVGTAREALILLDVIRSSSDPCETDASGSRLGRGIAFTADHLEAILRLCLTADRRATGRQA